MMIEILSEVFSVCKVSKMPCMIDGIVFTAVTDKEISIVCQSEKIDFATVKREDGWRCMRISGELDFSLLGILAGITGILRDAGISVFCVSTYDTDYILVKEDRIESAAEALCKNGYEIKRV